MPVANVQVTRKKMKSQLQWTLISTPKIRPMRNVPITLALLVEPAWRQSGASGYSSVGRGNRGVNESAECRASAMYSALCTALAAGGLEQLADLLDLGVAPARPDRAALEGGVVVHVLLAFLG